MTGPANTATIHRVALYVRVSTTDQRTEPQLDVLQEYAQARKVAVVEVYTDHGISGAKARRPALDRLLADARRRRFDAVVVVKLDRLGRNLHHLLVLLGELEALGVDLVALDDGLDSSTPVGKLFFQIRGAFAEYERALIGERAESGRAAARRRGTRFGRPRSADQQQLDRIRRLREAGQSIREIAKVVGLSRSAVARELQGVEAVPKV